MKRLNKSISSNGSANIKAGFGQAYRDVSKVYEKASYDPCILTAFSIMAALGSRLQKNSSIWETLRNRFSLIFIALGENGGVPISIGSVISCSTILDLLPFGRLAAPLWVLRPLSGRGASPAYGASFDMIMVPDAANMPHTTVEILASGICAGAVPRIWRALSCNAYMPYFSGCM
jgi:hypothetical protein